MEHAKWIKCIGEAHGNPFIDHCMVCLPYWGSYPTCPYCGKACRKNASGHKTKCHGCNKFYIVDRADDPHR